MLYMCIFILDIKKADQELSHVSLSQNTCLKNQKAKQGLTLTITVILYQQPVPNPGILLTVWSLLFML